MKKISCRLSDESMEFFKKLKRDKGISRNIIFNNLLKEFLLLDVDDLKTFINENFKYEKEISNATLTFYDDTYIEVITNKFKDIKKGDIYKSIIDYFIKLSEQEKEQYYKKY